MSNTGFGPATFVTPAVNYGSDLDCVTDLTPTMAETSGLHLLAEALVRRLSTKRGTLIDDPNYGYDLRDEIGDDVSLSDISRIQSQIDAELVKDERVRFSQSKAVYASGVLTVVTTVTPSAGPTFNMTISVTSLTVALLSPTL